MESNSQHGESERAIGFMTNRPEILTASAFPIRLGVFYAAFFAGVGVQMPFFPLWLEAKGLDPRWIGIVLSAPVLVRLLAVPIVTREADRRDALRAAIIVGSVGTMAGYAVIGLADGPFAILMAFTLASALATPVIPLTDAYALRGLRRHGGIYGPVRLWGSAAFIVGNLAAGLLSTSIPPDQLIWLVVAGWAAAALASFTLAPLHADEPANGPEASATALLRNPALLVVIAAAALIQASHATFYVFSTIDWRAASLDGLSIGALWALGVLAEIVLFAFAGRLPAAVGPAALLGIGAAGGVMRWTVMALDPPTLLLPLLQCLHALSFGATHLGAMGFLARAAPTGLAATAQGYLAVAVAVAMAVLMMLSGLLYAAHGGLAYAAMALAAAAGGCFALLLPRLEKS